MTGPARAGLRLVVPLLLALATAGAGLVAPVAPASAAADQGRAVTLDASRLGSATRPPATLRVASRKKQKEAGQRVQRITVSWKGTAKKRVYTKTAVVPGIGQLQLTCRPDATFVRLYAEDRSAETQLWMAKYETKNNHAVVATKTARIYRYAHAGDDGTGGTGASASEGLNQLSTIENSASGYLDGIISQRPGRHLPVTGTAAKPATSLKLNWWWAGFRNPMSWRSCKIQAVLTTKTSPRMGVNWHGDADAATTQYAEYVLPSLGTLQLRCEPDVGGVEGRRTIALAPVLRNNRSRIWMETVTGEGRVEDHVDSTSLAYDSETGRIGSFALPRNGMLRFYATVGSKTRAFILSSYQVTNNAARPEQNLCETAVAPY